MIPWIAHFGTLFSWYETSAEQLMWPAEPIADQQCYWSMVSLSPTVDGRTFSRIQMDCHTEHLLSSAPLPSRLRRRWFASQECNNSVTFACCRLISIKLCIEKSCWYSCFKVFHLPATKHKIAVVEMSFFSQYWSVFEHNIMVKNAWVDYSRLQGYGY